VEQWTIEANMQDGALIEETTTDYRRFTALWVGFTIDDDRYWLQAESARVTPLTSSTWFVWVGIAILATIIGSATIEPRTARVQRAVDNLIACLGSPSLTPDL